MELALALVSRGRSGIHPPAVSRLGLLPVDESNLLLSVVFVRDETP